MAWDLPKTQKWEIEEQGNERVCVSVRREIVGGEKLNLISWACQIKSHCTLGLQGLLGPRASGPTHKC